MARPKKLSVMAAMKEDETAVSDAQLVNQMKGHPGWEVLKRDIEYNLEQYRKAWIYLKEGTEESHKLKILALACYQMLEMVEHYDSTYRRELETLLKKLSEEEAIPMDMDNETPLKEE